jgi:hypothetical protein
MLFNSAFDLLGEMGTFRLKDKYENPFGISAYLLT